MKPCEMLHIGVVSDTHGLLRDEVLETFTGTDLIIHAGDVGAVDVLETLEQVAPVVAVRGNMDGSELHLHLEQTEMVAIGDEFIYVLHNIHDLDLVPEASGIHAVISGHTHTPSIRKQNGVLYLNPGGAGHRRFHYPVTVALLDVRGNEMAPRIVELRV